MQDKKQIYSLQVLRGIAATLVAAFHLNAAGVNETNYTGLFSIFQHGEVGVDIFFVISGFIIFYTSNLKSDQTASVFFTNRFYRIMPPYWCVLSIYIAAAFGAGLLLGDNTKIPSFNSLITSIFLLPLPDHIIIIAWTLSVEIMFYAVFGMSYFKYGRKVFFLTMLIWVILSQIYRLQSAVETSYLPFVLNPLVMEFLFGAVIADVYRRGENRFQSPAFLVGTLLMICYMTLPLDTVREHVGREVLAGVPSALLVYGILSWRGRVPKLLTLWGDASYILYLIHIVLFSLVGRGMEELTGMNVYGSTFSLALMLALAITVSCLATTYLERPYRAWYRKRLRNLSKDGFPA